MIEPFNFATVVGRKATRNSGLELGETVFVSSTKVAPEKRSDPYLQRIYVLVMKMDEEGNVLIPKEDNEHKVILVDPRNLQKVSDEEQKRLVNQLREVYEE